MSECKDSDPYSSDDNREVHEDNKKRRSSIFQPRPSEHHLGICSQLLSRSITCN